MIAVAKKEVGYLYVNGLGKGKFTPKDKLVRWWWARAGRTIEHAHINWYDGERLEEKERQVRGKVNGILQTHSGVAIIGASAGGGLALNVFASIKKQNICVITAHARLRVGKYKDSDRMSLFHRAKPDTKYPSRAFFDSVTKAETLTIPKLTGADLGRILSLTQLTDMVVALRLMEIEGAQGHRSIAFGHSGGFLAHLLVDRDRIIKFAEHCLG